MAVARAFAHRPKILFADEPTGNLDAANGQNVVALLGELNRELGTTLVLVTHEPDLAAPRPPASSGCATAPSSRTPRLAPAQRVRWLRFVLSPRLARVAGLGAPGPAHRPLGGDRGRPPSWPSTPSRTTCAGPSGARPGRCSAPTSRSPPPLPSRRPPRRSSARCAGRRRPAADVARVVSFGAMALKPGGQTTRLAQVLAVDPGYPFYGAIETAPAGEWARLAETGGAVADASLLVALGARIGDEIALGEARFVLRATVENVPGDVGVRSAFGPRVFIPRARVGETGLLTRGSRARYEAYLRLPPGSRRPEARRPLPPPALRRAPQRPHGLRRPAAPHRHALPLRQLPRPRRARGPPPRRPRASRAPCTSSSSGGWPRSPSCAASGATGGTVLAAYLVQAVAVGLLGSLAGAALGAAVQVALPRLLKDVAAGGRGLVPLLALRPRRRRRRASGWRVVFSLLPLLAVRRVSPSPSCAATTRGTRRPAATSPAYAAALALAASLVALAVIQAGRLSFGLAFAAGVGPGPRRPVALRGRCSCGACAASSPGACPTSTARASPTSTARRTRR